MPTENEFKYILSHDIVKVIPFLSNDAYELKQGYLTDDGSVRVRQTKSRFNLIVTELTFKRKVDDRLVEIETDIDAADFNDLFDIVTNKIHKFRHTFTDYPGLTVDFLYDSKDCLYFAIAEWEVAEDVKVAPELPEFLKKYLLYQPKQDDYRFTNFKLSSPSWAKLAMECIVPWKKEFKCCDDGKCDDCKWPGC